MNTNKRYLNILVPTEDIIYLGTEKNCKIDDLINSQYITFKICYNRETLNIRLNLKYAGWNTEKNAISFRLLGGRKLSAYNVDKKQYVDFTTDELHTFYNETNKFRDVVRKALNECK